MSRSRPVSRRLLLRSSAAILGCGALCSSPAWAQPASVPPVAPGRAAVLRPHNAATLPDYDHNPHRRPIGPPLSHREQKAYHPHVVHGRGL